MPFRRGEGGIKRNSMVASPWAGSGFEYIINAATKPAIMNLFMMALLVRDQ